MTLLTRPAYDEYCQFAVDFNIAPFGPGRVSSELGARRGFCVSLKDRSEKKCPACSQVLPREAFALARNRPDGLQAYCRACQSVQGKAYYAAHQAEASERFRAWRLENPDKQRERYQRWAEANPERAREKNQRWYKENAEKSAGKSREWYKAHREDVLRRLAIVRRRKAKLLNARERARRAANPERVRARERMYRAKRADVYRDKAHRYRVALRKLYVEPVIMAVLAERDHDRCAVCGKYVKPEDWSIDHIVPVSRGGEHSYANTQLAHKRCNSSRGNRGPAQMRLLP